MIITVGWAVPTNVIISFSSYIGDCPPYIPIHQLALQEKRLLPALDYTRVSYTSLNPVALKMIVSPFRTVKVVAPEDGESGLVIGCSII